MLQWLPARAFQDRNANASLIGKVIFFLVNCSGRGELFPREEILCQNLKPVLSGLTYAGRKDGFQEGPSEGAEASETLEPGPGWPGRQSRGGARRKGRPQPPRTGSEGHLVSSQPPNNNSDLRNSSHQVLSDGCVGAGSGRLRRSLVCCYLNLVFRLLWKFLKEELRRSRLGLGFFFVGFCFCFFFLSPYF